MSNWFADRTGLHWNLRPLAPIAGGILGNVLMPGLGGMALGSALGRFGDGVGNGEGIMQAAKHGAIDGAVTYGGGKALGALHNAFAPGSEIAANAAGAGGGEAAGAGAASGGSGVDQAADALRNRAGLTLGGGSAGAGAAGAPGAFHSAMNSLGSFADTHANAIGEGLKGLGAMGSMGSENALRNAQAQQLMAQTQAQNDENEAKKQRAAALEPLLRALMGGNGIHIPANPYAG